MTRYFKLLSVYWGLVETVWNFGQLLKYILEIHDRLFCAIINVYGVQSPGKIGFGWRHRFNWRGFPGMKKSDNNKLAVALDGGATAHWTLRQRVIYVKHGRRLSGRINARAHISRAHLNAYYFFPQTLAYHRCLGPVTMPV